MENKKTTFYWSKVQPQCVGSRHRWGRNNNDEENLFRCVRCGTVKITVTEPKRVYMMVSSDPMERVEPGAGEGA